MIEIVALLALVILRIVQVLVFGILTMLAVENFMDKRYFMFGIDLACVLLTGASLVKVL
jgi:hypothetical protein